MANHEQTIESHVDSNVTIAIDQADEYGGLRDSFDSFLQNTRDSVVEDGYSDDDAFDATFLFVAEFNKRTGCGF